MGERITLDTMDTDTVSGFNQVSVSVRLSTVKQRVIIHTASTRNSVTLSSMRLRSRALEWR